MSTVELVERYGIDYLVSILSSKLHKWFIDVPPKGKTNVKTFRYKDMVFEVEDSSGKNKIGEFRNLITIRAKNVEMVEKAITWKDSSNRFNYEGACQSLAIWVVSELLKKDVELVKAVHNYELNRTLAVL